MTFRISAIAPKLQRLISELIRYGFLFGFIAIASDSVSQSSGAKQNTTVPPPPESLADRFGVYNWNVSDAGFPKDGSTDRLNWAANKVAELGSRTIRISLSAYDIYQVQVKADSPLVVIAKSPAFDKLLRDPRFNTIILTTYTAGDMRNFWADGFTQAEYEIEREEIRNLGEYLLGNPSFTGKTFIILNWEGDNAVYYHSNKRGVWDYYVEWVRSRAEGVKLARQNVPSSYSKLYSGLEFNAVRSIRTNKPCGEPVADPINNDPLQNRCVIDYVAPRVEVDYYSMSSWQIIEKKLENPAENLKQLYYNALDFALAKVRQKRPEIGERNFIVGEFGYERAKYGECNAANFVNETFDAFSGPGSFQASYVIFWQIMDNAPYLALSEPLFGLYRYRDEELSLTLLGETFKKRIAGQGSPFYSGCPAIRRPPPFGGVLNSQGTAIFFINPDSVVSIYAEGCCESTDTPFSLAGNVVHFDQNAREYLLPRDNPLHFYESTMQINFSMPPSRRMGHARVYMTDARGIDSNGQYIFISCDECPQIANSCGILDSTYQTLLFEPGQPMTITGSLFSKSGNKVIIEQYESQQKLRRWTLQQESILEESTTQIKAKLPNDLLRDREALIHVETAGGLESSESLISIYSPGSFREPRLKPCRSLAPDAGDALLAAYPVTLFGRFKPSGNTIILEQFDSQNRFYRTSVSLGSADWSESESQIRLRLPYNIFPGRVVYYVIDSNGIESRAHDAMVAPNPVATVSAASYRGQSLAIDSIAASFGTGMSLEPKNAESIPLPIELGGTRAVIKDSSGVDHNAPLFYVSPGQVNLHIPTGLATGPASLTIFNGFGSSSSGTIQISNLAPGMFTAQSDGKGVAAAVVLRIRQDGTRIFEDVSTYDQATNKFLALPVDLGPPTDEVFLIAFGTGLRARSSLSAVTATIGGIAVEATYAGKQEELVGLDQINLKLPRTLAGKGEVNVELIIDAIRTNPIMINMK